MVAVWWNVNKRTDSNTYSSACSSVKRYHKTLPLMGATRPASGIKEKDSYSKIKVHKQC